jgi:hypothetical protein
MDHLIAPLLPPETFRPSQKQGRMMLALTLAVIIIVIIMCADPAVVTAIIAALVGFCAAYIALGGRSRGAGGPSASAMSSGEASEGFFTGLPGAPAPYVVTAEPRLAATAHMYPGAIDLDEYDSEATYGHRDLTEGDNDFVPYGNPFNTGRIAAPPAADSCIDDEANDDQIDGDERNTYQTRARNDATRATAGTMNRRQAMDKFFREECEESDDQMWWGRHEE